MVVEKFEKSFKTLEVFDMESNTRSKVYDPISVIYQNNLDRRVKMSKHGALYVKQEISMANLLRGRVKNHVLRETTA